MEDIFIKILNMSITASYFVVALILLRAVFRKIPKWLSCSLWGLVGLRLILPFSFNSILSIIPSAETVPSNIMYEESPFITSGIGIVDAAAEHILYRTVAPNPGDSANPLQIITAVAAFLWVTGIAVMLVYALVSFLLVRRKTRLSIRTSEGYYICDSIASPFILGVIRPKIFIPSVTQACDIELILSHEKAHIKRLDHLWKPLGFLILSVYWFNPLMWLAYIFLCRDIEAACDEKVLKNKGTDIKKSYSEALINCSAGRRLITACPLAFGETDVKSRIKNILSYKKPALWLIVIALIVSIILSVCFMTNPDGMKLNDITGYEDMFRDVEKIQLFTGTAYIFTTEDVKPELSDLKKVRVEKATDETQTDKSYRIEINDEVTININTDFSTLFLSKTFDGVERTSECYKVIDPEVLRSLFFSNNYVTERPGIYVTIDEVYRTESDFEIRAIWHNESNSDVEYGEMFTIERYNEQGIYEKVSFPEDFVFLLPAYILKAGTEIEKNYYCPMSLSDGEYRFTANFTTKDGKTYYTKANFVIGPLSNDHTKPLLSLEDVKSLSEKGKDLTWSDFEGFSYVETGSGLYIRSYTIDGRFSLAIGGTGTDTEPMYIYLCAPDGSAGKFIDIRQDDVEQFIEENKDNPIPAEGYLTFSKWLFPVDTTGDNMNKIIKFGAFLPVNYNRIKTYPTIKIDSIAEFNEFYDYFKNTMDFNALSDYTGISFSQFKDAWFFENSSYFEENTLLLIYVTAPNKLNSFDVDFLRVYDDILHINIREGIYETDDNTTTGWLIAIETSKGYTEDIKHINAYVSSTVNLPEPQITHLYIQKSGNKVYGSSFELYDNGTFMLSVSPHSSFLEIGSFAYEGDLLILTSEDNERRYVFEVNSDHIIFKRNESAVYKLFTEEEVPDGTKFILQ